MNSLTPADDLLNMTTFGPAMNNMNNTGNSILQAQDKIDTMLNNCMEPNNYNMSNETPPPTNYERSRTHMPSPILHVTKAPSKRKLFKENKELMLQAASTITTNERKDVEDLENFAQHFKKQRIKLVYTQNDVGMELGKRYGTDFSQTTISRFEALNLSFKNMRKLRPYLNEWLTHAESAKTGGSTVTNETENKDKQEVPPQLVIEKPPNDHPTDFLITINEITPCMKRRRKRTNLNMEQRTSLDAYFNINPRPSNDKIKEIAKVLALDSDVVRVWFCNTRQKMRRTDPVADADNLFMHVESMTNQSNRGQYMSGEDVRPSTSVMDEPIVVVQ